MSNSNVWGKNIEFLLAKRMEDCSNFHNIYLLKVKFQEKLIKFINIILIILAITSAIFAILIKIYTENYYVKIFNIIFSGIVTVGFSIKTYLNLEKTIEKFISMAEKYMILHNIIEAELAKNPEDRKKSNIFIDNVTRQFNFLLNNKYNIIIEQKSGKILYSTINSHPVNATKYTSVPQTNIKIDKNDEYQLERYFANL